MIKSRKFRNFRWVDIFNPTEDEIEKASKEFGISLSDIKDFLDSDDVPRIGRESKRTIVFFRVLTKSSEMTTISAIIGRKFLLTFHEEKARSLAKVFQDKKPAKSQFDIIQRILDESVKELEKLSDRIEKRTDMLEESLIKMGRVEVAELYRLRELVGSIYRSLILNKTVLSELSHISAVFQDLYYDTLQLIDLYASHKDSVTNLIDLHMNIENIRLQEVMKMLAAITAIAAIPTIISSIYGMNFRHIPFSQQPYGFHATILAMLMLMAVAYLFFKKKGWI